MKIKKNTLIVVMYIYIVLGLFIIPAKAYNYTSYIIATVLFLSMLFDKKYSFLRKNLNVSLYAIVIVYSTIHNFGINSKFNYLALFYAMSIIVAFYVADRFVKNRGVDKLSALICKLFSMILVITDALIFMNIPIRGSYYLVGDKFAVAYLHCFVAAFLGGVDNKNYSIFKYFYFVYAMFICFFVDCSTGVVALFFVFVMCYFRKQLIHIIPSKKCILLFWGGTFLLFNSIESLLQINLVQNLVQNILRTDVSLTGRMNIYRNLLAIISNKPIWGYGYLNNIISETFSSIFSNAQNGTMKLMVDFGIVGVVSFGLMMYNAFDFKSVDEKIVHQYYPYFVMVYTLILCSIIEISFGYYFIFALAVVATGKSIALS